MSVFGVVIMDIVGSRNIKERGQLQDSLITFIEKMNKKHIGILTTPISITLGDEWQLISGDPSECYNFIHEFQQLLWELEVDLYAGIGVGNLSTRVYEDIRLMDGPCFNLAREAINIAKKGDGIKKKHIHSKNNRVFFLSGPKNLVALNRSNFNETNPILRGGTEYINQVADSLVAETEVILKQVAVARESVLIKQITKTDNFPLIDLINSLIENNEILKARMTQKQRNVYMDYQNSGSYRSLTNFKESPGGISQKLNSAEYFTIQQNHKIIKSLLGFYCE